MFKFLSIPLYIKVYANKFVISVLDESNLELVGNAGTPFTAERLLVGNFTAAEKSLSSLMKKVTRRGVIKKSPTVLIQPMEKIEGGLSEIELRIFKELALSCGAVNVVIHTGQVLNKEQALTKLEK